MLPHNVERLAGQTALVLNLASREYSQAVEPYLPKTVWFVTCTFGEQKGGKITEKGTLCKMAPHLIVGSRFYLPFFLQIRQDLRPTSHPISSPDGRPFSLYIQRENVYNNNEIL